MRDTLVFLLVTSLACAASAPRATGTASSIQSAPARVADSLALLRLHERGLSVYEKQGGGWRMTAIASTDRPDAP